MNFSILKYQTPYFPKMKNIITFILLFLPSIFFAQTNISGIINVYTAVQNIENCTAEVTVEDPSDFTVGNKVMLIQMQGASMVDINNAAFGTIQNLVTSGLYEINTISQINGNTIKLQNNIINTYVLSGKVQMVSIPVYENATVVDNIIPLAWDGSKGGVVAFEVENTLNLDANISADGAGFRGGVTTVIPSDCNGVINHSDYYYNVGNWRGAPKGEGIAAFVNGKEWGRGAQASGGGGGNDHNAGGGGGSNVSAGGQGGNRTPDGFFDCDGEYPGLGGKSFQTTAERAFLGGGGGAGHTDNTGAGSNGGNGGGIIYIKANTIQGNNNEISAKGLFNDATGDGGGGGGAGGTIIIDVETTDNALNVIATGGKGGNTNSQTGACGAPGGGGSGGRLISNAPLSLTINLSAGDAGVNNNPVAECNGASNGAVSGQDGNFQPLETIPQGQNPVTALTINEQLNDTLYVCEDNSASVTLNAQGTNISYQWQLNAGNGFENITDNTTYSGANTSTLSISNVTSQFADWSLQVIISNECDGEITSEPILINPISLPVANFTYINSAPFTLDFIDNTQNAFSIFYDFGDGTTSSEPNPSHFYEEPGNYTVTQVVMGACGTDTYQQNISLAAIPTATFTSSDTTGCTELSIDFTNASVGVQTYVEWHFPGGSPDTSYNHNPTVVYENPGNYNVILIVGNESGNDTLVSNSYIQALTAPDANFTYSVNGTEVTFISNAINSDNYLWDFGDNTTSTQENPSVHNFPSVGVYEVCLTTSNQCGSSEMCMEVVVGSQPNALFSASQVNGCSPFSIDFTDESTNSPTEWLWQFPGGTPSTSTEQNPTVLYETPGNYTVSLTVQNSVNSDIEVRSEYIIVQELPEAQFSFATDINNNYTFIFTNETQPNSDIYIWDFGDGTTSYDTNPVHTYAIPGTYLVTLNALNGSCGGSTSQQVGIINGTEEANLFPTTSVFPNPFVNVLFISFDEMLNAPVNVEIISIDGKTVLTEYTENTQNIRLDTATLPSGMYVVQITYKGEQIRIKVVK